MPETVWRIVITIVCAFLGAYAYHRLHEID